ncbi:MAG: GNAT family N-acetyltransferase [Alphaproteobacteria bacterium]|nr:GNAT family N-acetyltransferase [Alphaproteobacteria bacterium]
MNLPEIIKGEKVTLIRPYPVTFELAKEIFEAIDSSRSSLEKWFAWTETTKSAEDSFIYLIDWCQKHWEEQSGFAYIIRENKNDEFVGMIDLVKVSKSSLKTQFGYWLKEDAQGNGYMHDAVTTLEKVCFECGFNRIEIRNNTANTRSANVAKRAGYHLDGILRQNRWDKKTQSFHDSNVWSKIKSDLK